MLQEPWKLVRTFLPWESEGTEVIPQTQYRHQCIWWPIEWVHLVTAKYSTHELQYCVLCLPTFPQTIESFFFILPFCYPKVRCVLHITKFHSQTNQYACSLPQTKTFPPNEFMFKSTIITKPSSAWLLDIPNVHVWFVEIQQKRWSLNTQQQKKLHIFRKSPPAPNPQLTKSDPKFLKKMLSGTKESSQHQSKPQPWHLPS